MPPDVRANPQLKHLYLSFNRLTTPPDVRANPQLINLDLSETN